MKATIIYSEIRNEQRQPFVSVYYDLLIEDGTVLECKAKIKKSKERLNLTELTEHIQKYHSGIELQTV